MQTAYDDELDSLPAEIVHALQEARTIRRGLAERAGELKFLTDDLDRWPTGDTVSVAFLGGSYDLHAKIAGVAQQISNACGIDLDFGHNPKTGSFRRWAESDTEYRADVRVSFDMPDCWALVGTASIDRTLTDHHAGVGGGPHQRSLNLGGFDLSLPDGWRRIVLFALLRVVALSSASAGDTLSAGDLEGLRQLYPERDEARVTAALRAFTALTTCHASGAELPQKGLEQILLRLCQ